MTTPAKRDIVSPFLAGLPPGQPSSGNNTLTMRPSPNSESSAFTTAPRRLV
jgi:hypothetical protein